MRLHRVVITGYRSIQSETQLHLEPDVTIVLGPNDHGKTNCLSALLHLNKDAPFVEDVDLNWDNSDRADALPSVTAYFTLTADEIARVIAAENPLNEKHNQKVLADRAARKEQGTEQAEEMKEPKAQKLEEPSASEDELYELLTPGQLGGEVVVKRIGVKGEREIDTPGLTHLELLTG